MNRSLITRLAAVLLVVAMPAFAFAIGKPSAVGGSMSWDIDVSGHESIVLTVQHDGEIYTKTFKAGKAVVFNLKDMPSDVPVDGPYDYQLSVVPNISPGLKKQLEAARATGDEKASQKVFKAAGIVVPQPQSGTFTVLNGSIVDPNATEGGNNARVGTPTSDGVRSSPSLSGPASRFKPEVLDQVIPDDLIVQGSICTGFDCVNNESFGVDTIKLKENNLRIFFEDTSTSAGFASNDWRIVANDQPSGGANKFAIEDATAARTPMTIEADAPANALYVDSTGNIGLQQSAPGLDLHITTSDTPAMRYEQTNAGGFTAQTWDIGANEANFFVRDVTGGSRLSFRIRPGAPTSSVDIAADGDVGIGTASPRAKLHVMGTGAVTTFPTSVGAADFIVVENNGNANLALVGSATGQSLVRFTHDGSTITDGALTYNYSTNAMTFITNDAERARIDTNGSMGIGTTSPSSRLHVNGGDVRVSGGSFIDDGVTLNAPDYVFDESYKLMSIDELASFIKTEKHLPNVPSATEFKAKGINLSKLGFNLLEKVEELTLYTVAQHEQIGTLKAQNQELLDRLAALEAKVSKQ